MDSDRPTSGQNKTRQQAKERGCTCVTQGEAVATEKVELQKFWQFGTTTICFAV